VRECERDHLVLSGNDGVCFAPGASVCRALPRGSALGPSPMPGSWLRFPEYVVARRHAVSGTAPSGSVGWPIQRCRGFFYRSRSQSRARLRRVGASHRRPLSSDLARQTHWHLSGWTEQSRGWVSKCSEAHGRSWNRLEYRVLTGVGPSESVI
jgi:hypothetical protein